MAAPVRSGPDGPPEPVAHRSYDAIVVGAGHNGLVTAAYLAKAGLRTIVLERREHAGGVLIGEDDGSREFDHRFIMRQCIRSGESANC